MWRKLGLKEGCRALVVGAPGEVVGEVRGAVGESGVVATSLRGTRPFDVIVCCCDRAGEMERRLPGLVDRLETAGGLWLCWPKRSSGVATDLSDGAVRALGLGAGLVDNKTCAVTDVWSGLRFVRRLRDR